MPGTTRTGYGTGRERLRLAARDVLVNSGGDLDVEVVAARAGVSKSLIWRRFGNRAGLLTAVVDEFWAAYEAAIADTAIPGGLSWADRERQRLHRLVDFLADEPLAPIVLSHVEGDAELHHMVKGGRLAEHVRAAANNIRHGQTTGAIDASLEPAVAAAMIVGGIHQTLVLALTQPRDPNIDPDQLAESIWRPVAAILGLRHQPTRRARPAGNTNARESGT